MDARRAARVIIDHGLHVGDMTFEQAVKMLTDEVHLERSLAVSEVRRYTEDPTQPSAYIIGREKIPSCASGQSSATARSSR